MGFAEGGGSGHCRSVMMLWGEGGGLRVGDRPEIQPAPPLKGDAHELVGAHPDVQPWPCPCLAWERWGPVWPARLPLRLVGRAQGDRGTLECTLKVLPSVPGALFTLRPP